MRWRRGAPPQQDLAGQVGVRKLLPEINRDYCKGCGRCIAACPAHCLELIWSFSTLVRPDACTSCGECVEACPEHLLKLTWQPSAGARDCGQWRDE